ncbi:hypothetical protein NUU61_006788 [Penicillium alfredii]|uniref:Sulfatase N-terminal domain-containing protein n=1 Tax=Penicillium alfredii TaxID=1506179 RepID=A0A9W9K3N2_9EURO|nr:uncharacterized protein NUU61_006788 [Penicillium alfredii]KAJ5091918.1 hypothetical protein NUU61_006788 [Penicillium alfredii]
MKFPSNPPALSQSLLGWAEEAAISIVMVVRSPQQSLDSAWAVSRKYFFSVIFISLLVSKFFHVCVQLTSMTAPSFLPWGPTFFLVDIVLILVACGLARWFEWRIIRDIAAVVTVAFGIYASSIASADISFYVHTGAEIFYPQKSKGSKPNPAKWTVLSAFVAAIFVDGVILVGAYFATPHLFRVTKAFLEIWGSLLFSPFGCCRRQRTPSADSENYEQIAIDDYDENNHDSENPQETENHEAENHRETDPLAQMDTPREKPEQKRWSLLHRVLAISFGLIIVLLCLVRPYDRNYTSMSESLAFAPFASDDSRSTHGSAPAKPAPPANQPPPAKPATPAKPTASEKASPTWATPVMTPLPSDFSWLEDTTALDTFPKFDWLPSFNSSNELPDWSPFRLNRHDDPDYDYEHYNPQKDPLHIPNLHNDILEPIREAIHNGSVKIKHVVLLKLESTRQDMWPFSSSSYIMKHIRESYPDGEIPKEVLDRLSSLTPTAERLTGSDNGFRQGKESSRPKPYGGITANNSWTAGTYSLKSLTGTFCGVDSMAVEGNHEYQHDIYQPCFPHILSALNNQPKTTNETDDWGSWPWRTMYFQASSDSWDHHYDLTPEFGFEDTWVKRTIDEAGGKYIPEESEEEKGHGHEDKVMKNYFRDAIEDAKKNNTRLFIAHLTHNTHTPYYIPREYKEMLGDKSDERNERLERYLNTMAYQDEWVSDILKVFEDAGVADETLFIMTGDHGLSLPNDGGITARDSPHVANFHVPLLFAHPKLPQLEIDNATMSTQILPTILDLLIETSSVNEESTKILRDLLSLYGGQSIIRTMIPEQMGWKEWHFGTTNPGGGMVCLRSAAQPYRLVVPLNSDGRWRFTNFVEDPFELEPLEENEADSLITTVEKKHGPDAANWLDEASQVATWWIDDNFRRWKWDPSNPDNEYP